MRPVNPGVSAAAALGGLLLARPLAGLTLTVPDRENRQWWRGARPAPTRSGAVGVVGAVFAALAATAAGWSPDLPAWLLLALLLTPLAVIDIEHHRLPNRLLLPGLAAGPALLAVAALVGRDGDAFVRSVVAGVAAFAVFAAAALTNAIGFGDVKLIGLLAAYLGWIGWEQVVLGIFAGFVIGALAALVLMALRRARWHSDLAFGPSLMLGALLVAAWSWS